MTVSSRIRVLFIGFAQSTHTHAWISLLDPARFDVRLHGVQGFGLPPEADSIRMTATPSRSRRLRQRIARRLLGADNVDLEMQYLTGEIDSWRPGIIHTLGLDPASYFFLDLRRKTPPRWRCPWVVTARGGPELALNRLIPREAARIREVMAACDQLIADNELNYEHAVSLGLAPGKVSPLGRMPGVGGVDIATLQSLRKVPAVKSRVILMPKAYDCPASKVLPVFEALKICGDRIQPCEIHFTAATPEAEMWFATLPPEIRAASRLHGRLSREALLALMGQSRVLLAPSLTDGVPNVLYEAMASGCAPILSPLETLQPLVAQGVRMLFARNLFPMEIAEALVKAMTDDALIESMVAANSGKIRDLADRQQARTRVSSYYESLVQGGQ